jgi:GMP synthase-like glutamine amidotransferase
MKLAFLDPYVESPALNSFNNMVTLLNIPLFYFPVAKNSLEDLDKISQEIDAYIVVGSLSHVSENLPWHRPLFDFLMKELQKNKPVLGCCFTHQLFAHFLGGKIDYFSKSQEKREGSRRIEITHTSGPYSKGETFELTVSHQQVVIEAPPELLEIGRGLSYDILLHKSLPLLLTQAHPEVSSLDDEFTQRGTSLLNGKEFIQRFFKHHGII